MGKEALLQGTFEKLEPLVFYRELFPDGSLRAEYTDYPYYTDKGCAMLDFQLGGDLPELLKNKAKAFVDGGRSLRKCSSELSFFGRGTPDSYESFCKSLDARVEAEASGLKKWSFTKMLYDGLAELEWGYCRYPVYLAPISYQGFRRCGKYAKSLFAVVIDLDDVTLENLQALLNGFLGDVDWLAPTYLVNSGHGVHVYYALEEPVELWDGAKKQIDKLKKGLGDLLYHKNFTSSKDAIDTQWWGSTFRMVGSWSKLGEGYPVTAYRVGKPVSLHQLNMELYEGDRIDLYAFEPFENIPKTHKLGGTKKRTADRKYYLQHRAVFDKWLERVRHKARVGTRYYCMTVLFATAKKCGVSKQEAYEKATGMLKHLNRWATPKDYFTVADIDAASRFYDGELAMLMTLDYMTEKTEIELPRNPRRPKGERLSRSEQMARINKALDSDSGVYMGVCGVKKLNNKRFTSETARVAGLANKKQQIFEYLDAHPETKKTELARALGISRNTASKWFNAWHSERG